MTQHYELICPRCHQLAGTNPSCTVCNSIPVNASKVDEKTQNVPLTEDEYIHLGRS